MNDGVSAVVVTDVKTERLRADVAVTPDEKRTEDGLSEEVEDSVKDTLRVDGDDVASLAHTPCDGVQGPEECGERSTNEESLASVGADAIGVLAGLPDEHVEDVEESDAAKGEVSPLVGGRGECSDETGDDHDLVDENYEEGGGPWHPRGEEQVHEKQRGSDDPVDVSDVVDLTEVAANLGVAALELDGDGGPTQVGGHGEVGNGSDHGDAGGDVVENTI